MKRVATSFHLESFNYPRTEKAVQQEIKPWLNTCQRLSMVLNGFTKLFFLCNSLNKFDGYDQLSGEKDDDLKQQSWI